MISFLFYHLHKEDILTKGNINDASGLTKRNSSVSWIKDKTICQRVFSVIKNKTEDFSNLYLDNISLYRTLTIF